MESNQKRFLIILCLFILADFISVSFTNIYLWQLTKDFQAILIFNACVFLAMALSGLTASVIGGNVGNKYILTGAMLFYACQFILLFFLGANVVHFLIMLGLLSGLAIGSESYAYNIISQQVTTGGKREVFFGIKTALLSSILFIGVPVLTFIVGLTYTYSSIFLFALLLVILVAILTLGLVLPQKKTMFHVLNSRDAIRKFPDLKQFLLAKYLFGIQNGLFWVVLGIVTLEFVGNIFVWGIFSSFLTLVSIAAAYLYGKLVTVHTGKYSAVLSTFLFAAITLVLATNWNFMAFVAYQIALVILTVVMSVSFDSFMATIIEEDPETTNLRSELNGIGEFVLDFGRLTPILLLILLHVSFDNTLYIRIAFVIVAPLPLLIMCALKKTQAFI